jgi:hypothetical protein
MTVLAALFELRGFEEGFWTGFWGGIAQLIVLGVVAFIANVVYQRFKEISTARQALVNEIDDFTVRLYKPRKMYQTLFDASQGESEGGPDALHHQAARDQTMQRLLEEIVEAVGRFRALQVKLVPLYGYHVELFAYYLAIWRYLKEVRQRMERHESLYGPHEKPEAADAFYRLIDAFRYRVSVEKATRHLPAPVQPPHYLLQQMRSRGDALYAEFFEQPGGKV